MPDSSRLAPLPVGPTGAPPRLGFRHLLAPALLTLGAAGLAGQRPWLSGHIAPVAGVMVADALVSLLAAVAWLGAAWLGSRVIDLVVARNARATPMPRLLTDLLRALLYGLAVLGILAFVLGQPVTGLVATSGVVIAVLGFALRNMIADIFSGIALNVEHPYRIGDWVELTPGVTGRVDEINWRATRLVTLDGTALVVPNGLAAGNRITNYSQPGSGFRAGVPVTLDAEVPVARAKRIILSAIVCCDAVPTEPRPDVMVDSITLNGVTYQARFWVADYSRLAATRDAVATTILEHLARAGLEPASPKQEMRRRSNRPPPCSALGLGRDLLSHVDLFAAFRPEEIDELASGMHLRHVAAGEAVVRQDETGTSLFLVAEGALDVRGAFGGRTLLLDHMGPGDVFGEMSLLTGQPRSASVIANTDAVVYELDKEALDPVLRRRPELAARLADLMGLRQRRNDAHRRATATAAVTQTATEHDLLARLKTFFSL
ncbi:mechanosensitive ion channel protein MscS [Azospirillum argentinense]|uniref:Small-conductance mechanosensitive channel n=2 Tax=Azospirillum argentinense TaxID=2970906 RepID=A0A060DKU7_9PROT|nr:mechanosensitive ion channel family protein [Azospirillum argentinense]AIB11394.1 mechanosensitive ion channel protein MscS [Azospirillum argentinense]EZQ08319.1 mechanosensitive ion channel protein MscS [Azospirillum argentinense]